MRKITKQRFWICAITILLPLYTFAQETCEPVHSIPYFTLNGIAPDASNPDVGSTHYNLKMSVGQPVFLDTFATNLSDHSIVSGLWAHYLKEPRAPILRASDGDFQDMVLLEWTIEDDQTGPPVIGDEVIVYRNGYVLTTLPITQTQYQDFNVFSGEHYTYGVTSSNNLGESKTDDNQGFTNPNGVITGHIETPSGNPVIDTKVVLTPNIGKSAFFDGTDDYIYYFDANTSANRQFSGLEGNYTIETWFRSVHTQQQTIFTAVDSSSSNHYILLELTDEGKVHWAHNPTAGTVGSEITTQYSYTQSGEDADWYHLAVVYEDNSMTMYIDGAIVGTQTADGPISDKVEIVLGKLSPYDHEIYFYGRLDDFRIWSLAREWEDIRKHADLTLSGEEWGLAAYWKFDEVDGEIIFDLTDKDNDGSLCGIERDSYTAPVFVGALSDSLGNYNIKGIYYGGGMTFTVTPSLETSIGRSLRFTEGDYISFTGQRIDLTAGYTLEGWVKTPGTAEQMIFAAVEPGSNAHRLSVSMTAAGALQFSHYGAQITSSGSFNDDLWHHWALTFDDSTLEMNAYVDGELAGSATGSQNVPDLSEPVIGRQSPDSLATMYFNGLLDEFRLWNNPRTVEQIGGTMNQSLSGDNYGLINYWRINEAIGDLTVDEVGQVTGTLHGTEWDRDIPLREVFTHWYEPESRQATLNASNTSVDLVDFTDQSMIPISGFVRYENTACFQEGVEILINGESLIPPIFTDSDGKFIVDREPGSAGDLLSVVYKDHDFTPPLIELPLIVQPITGLYFDDKVKHTISGVVAGGSCEFPIPPSQGEIRITATSIDGCTEQTVTVNESDGKSFAIEDLPPLLYNLSVTHPDPNITFIADTISLEELDRVRDFIYYAEPEAEFTTLPGFGFRDFPVIVEQRNVYPAYFRMFERYGDNTCDIESFELTVTDNISDTSYTMFMETEGEDPYILFTAKEVNILGGGSHPYQNSIQIVITDTSGRAANTEFWALVQGDSKIPGTDFSTTTSKMPWYILRVPPGDQSYTYMTTEQTLCNSVVMGRTDGNFESSVNTIHAGAEFEIITGAGFGVFAGIGIKTEITADISDTWSTTRTTVSIDETIDCLTTSETYTTSGDGLITGDDATVFIGGGYTVNMGAAHYLTVDTSLTDTSSDPVRIDTVLTMDTDGVTSTYIHSKYFIKNQLMPDLWIIAHNDSVGPDEQAQALADYYYWQYILEEDSIAIANAIPSVLLQIGGEGEQANNISFDAGSDMEYSYTLDSTSSHTNTFTVEDLDELAGSVGIAVNGIGYTNNTVSRTTGTNEETQTSDTTRSQTIGFILSDDDPGDGFAFSVRRDQFWNMPVFELIGGQSSCPYEEGSFARHVADISVNPGLIVDVLPDETAVFTISVGNNSSTGESNYYNLSVLSETNPGGAVLTVDGLNLAIGMDLFLEAGEVIEKTLSVTKGPIAYEYDNITLQLASLCEIDIANVLGTSPTNGAWTDVSVHFQQPCSESNIAVPEDGWLVSAADEEDTLWVTVTGYDLDDPNLDKIELQYRQAQDGGALTFVGENGDVLPFIMDEVVPPLVGFPLLSNSEKSNNEYHASRWTGLTTNIEGERRQSPVGSNQSKIENRKLKIENGNRQIGYELYGVGHKDFAEQSYDIGSNGPRRTDKVLPPIIRNPQSTMGSGDWFVAYTVPKDSLIDDFVLIPWNISPSIIIDGTYELRSVAYCQGSLAAGISQTVTGVIDRSPPQVLGLPEPVDGILGPDDQIRVTLNEDVACGQINIGAGDIQLINKVLGEPVLFEFTCGGNVITIEPTDANIWLENQTFEARISNLEDVYGNARPDSISWEFYVNRNPIEWLGTNIEDVVLYVDEEYSTTRQLVNNGGSNRDWDIIGGREGAIPSGDPLDLPTWLDISPTEGTLTPGSSQDISIALIEGLNFGEYNTTIYAAGTMGDEPLIIDIRKLCYEPQWAVNPPDYQYSMNITANLSTDGELSADVYDRIVALVDGEVRGVAEVTYVEGLEDLPNTHPYEIFLTIYSNVSNGEDLTFRVWDASECMELGWIEESYTFEANAALGTPTDPAMITATSQIISTLPFSSGWTWISLNLNREDMSLNSVTQNMNPSENDLIKDQTSFSMYVPGFGWAGTLDSLTNELMYLLRLSNEDTLEYVGYAVDPELDTIDVVSGWNWIGYLPQVNYPVDYALQSLPSQTGDLVKSQFEYAQFVEGIGWIGSLTYMNPHLGYMLKSYFPGELLYPFYDQPPVRLIPKGDFEPKLTEGTPEWNVNPQDYEFSMNITGQLFTHDSLSTDPYDMVGAFVDEECRGLAQPVYIEAMDKYLVFMTVYSSQAESEQIEFQAYNADLDEILYVQQTVDFEANQIVGTIEEPFVWHARYLGIGDPGYIPDEYSLAQNYPNPFNPTTTISYGLPEDADVTITVYNILGEVVVTLVNERQKAGYYRIQWNSRNDYGKQLAGGIYIYQISANSFVKTRKLVLLK